MTETCLIVVETVPQEGSDWFTVVYCGKTAVKNNVWGSPICADHSGDQEYGQM